MKPKVVAILVMMIGLSPVSVLIADPSEPCCRLDKSAIVKGNPCQWDQLFRSGCTNTTPLGVMRGRVLYVDGKLPRMKARLQNVLWKGKTFHGDGSFINRWPGFEAICAHVTIEASWHDGQPCFVMMYPKQAPIFGGMRDELREISPGLWLGRSYDSRTCTGKNYFLLECKPHG